YVPYRRIPILLHHFPHVTGVFAILICRRAAPFRPLVVSLARILLLDSDLIEIEGVVLALREPKDRLITSGQAPCCMQSVFKEPDDSIPKNHYRVLLDDGIEVRIQREHLAILDVVPDLPA